jgi:RNA recognition motif-containing protein
VLHCYVEARKPGGMVYLCFSTQDGAGKAVGHLHGRWFAGRTIRCEYLDPAAYASILPEAAQAIETAKATSRNMHG